MQSEVKLRVGTLDYRETLILVMWLRPRILNKEFRQFYNYFTEYVSFPKKNIDNYSMMLLKLYKNQIVSYVDNKPVLTARGKALSKGILSRQTDSFKDRWNRYITKVRI